MGEPRASGSETSFVAALRTGDAAAYERLVREESPRLLAVTRRILRNEDDARDALQDAFIQAFRNISSFAGASKLSTWLHRIAVNAALMKLRTRKRQAEDELEEAAIEKALPTFSADGHWAFACRDWSKSADGLLQARETRELVRSALDALPTQHRLVLVLRDIEEMDTQEAATALGISETACKVRLHRARHALRTHLAERIGDAEPLRKTTR